MLVNLNEQFVSTSLTCPPHLRRVEYVSTSLSGFFIEVRSNRQHCGTYFYRGKDLTGKTFTQKIAHSSEMSFSDAEKECGRLKTELHLKLSSGIDPRNSAPVKREIPTVDHYYNSDYLPFIKLRNRSWKSADGVYRRYIKPVFGGQRMVDITRKMVIDFHAELKSRGLSGATADHGLKLVRHIYNNAILNEVLTDNPAALAPCFNDFNEVNNTLSPEDLQRLLSVLTNDPTPIKLIARMLICTACRLSEILTATWNNCDMDKRILYITSENSKSKKPRVIQINDSAMEVLMLSNTRGKFDYLFINPRTKTRYFAVHKAWNEIRVEAQLPKLRLHDLRHFVASELASQGVSIYIISKLLGHANVVTSQRYSRVSNLATRKASDNISTVIQNALDKVS